MKIVTNNEKLIETHGKCKRSGEEATVTSRFLGSFECKTDLQKTYHFVGYTCSLIRKNAFIDPACMDECKLIQKEYL